MSDEGRAARGQVRLADEIPPGLSVIAVFDSLRKANERSLVILAMGRGYWIFKMQGRFYLCVRDQDADKVLGQVRLSEAENRNRPPPMPKLPPDQPASPRSLLAFACILTGFFMLQQLNPAYWRELGLMDNHQVFESGQIWRLLTALTLHADIGHLAGNVLAGICFGLLLNRIFGYGLGWCLVLLGGITGNLINGWFFMPELHRSLGASTAVFAALGILVGHAIRVRFDREAGILFRRRLMPLAGGLMMLAFTGFGGENTDITAHIFGFATGLPLGALAISATRGHIPNPPAQSMLAFATCLLITAAWAWAVT